ncbi:uncharacterized protein F5147DRAFT_779999 [Suillus discolor]|uniref:Uncharacterized protein n=1 Tax=Suillus discolor TaxID=1912936 RepID=A0A9P7JN55_9AGAM|nr:uncharacterized protein F5147DRAFT_779999 [Suillus discolor]KAG2091538.1 hypothetical protein F5147DRAFT_779999 [Suillus discolor]
MPSLVVIQTAQLTVPRDSQLRGEHVSSFRDLVIPEFNALEGYLRSYPLTSPPSCATQRFLSLPSTTKSLVLHPPFPPMLTDQLELFGSTHHPTILISDEILPAKASTIVPPIPALKGTPEIKLAAPSSRPIVVSRRTRREYHWSGFLLVTNSGSSTSAASLSEDSKIPKPPGEPGRPGWGGYTLQESLNWSPKAYTKFKKSMHHLVEEHLDTTKCASSQSPALLRYVRDKSAVDAFSDLDNYSSCWPVNDIIMMHLKYTSGRARQKEAGMALGKSKRKTHTSPVSSIIIAKVRANANLQAT